MDDPHDLSVYAPGAVSGVRHGSTDMRGNSDSERNGRQASFRKRDVFYREQAAYGSGRRRGRAHSYREKGDFF